MCFAETLVGLVFLEAAVLRFAPLRYYRIRTKNNAAFTFSLNPLAKKE